MSTYSSRYVVGQPTEVGGWPGRAAEVQREHEAVALSRPRAAATRCGGRTARTSAPAQHLDEAGMLGGEVDDLRRGLRRPARGRRSSHGGAAPARATRRPCQALTARDERAAASGFLTASVPYAQCEDRRLDVPRIEHPRTDIGDGARGAVGSGEVGAQAGRARPADTPCRSARGTASSAHDLAPVRVEPGEERSIDGDVRVDVAVDHGGAAGRPPRRRWGAARSRSRQTERRAVRHRHVQDVALGVVEAAVAVPVRLDDVGRPARRRARSSSAIASSRSSTANANDSMPAGPGARDAPHRRLAADLDQVDRDVARLEARPALPRARTGSMNGSPSTSR